MEINKDLLDKLFERAGENPRLRQNFDLRTSSADNRYDHVNSVTQNGFKCLVSNVPFYWLAIGF